MFNLFKKKTHKKPDLSFIVPRVKHTNMLAFFREPGIPEKDWPVTEPLVADLLITYAFDLPDVFQMITPAELNRLNLMPGELRAIAIRNLRQRIGHINTEGQGSPVYMLTAGKDLSACLLLFDEIWEDFAGQLPGKMVVAVPSRGIVLVTSDEWPEGLALMRELVDGVRERETTHQLSDVFLVRTQSTWTPFDESA
jgi:uncharacterized protein YtpQ (UPF0354 family)